MKWYERRFWRLAYAPRKNWCAEISDSKGRWIRIAGSIFILIRIKAR